ncbi:MAG TPA: hypothetical protein VJ647_06210 [Chitinophagaceae bacterium]|nr:hypothetical protein [Chitinophagaceae bacterium]
MALNGNTLGTEIYNTLNSFNNKSPDDTGDIEAARLNLCKALGAAIVTHITTNAVVLPTALAAPNGPVTGTGKVT